MPTTCLRGIPTTAVRDNLDEIILRIKASGRSRFVVGHGWRRVILGKGTTADAFGKCMKKLRDKHDVPLYPFFLHGVAFIPGTDATGRDASQRERSA